MGYDIHWSHYLQSKVSGGFARQQMTQTLLCICDIEMAGLHPDPSRYSKSKCIIKTRKMLKHMSGLHPSNGIHVHKNINYR